MNILLTGANGMVGQNIITNSLAANYSFITPSSKELNLLNYTELDKFFNQHSIDFIIHAAGIVGGIEANMTAPMKYLTENTQMGMNLVNICVKHKVKSFLNLASSCMYPKDLVQPLSEDMLFTGLLEPTNEGYAIAKLAVTKLCEYVTNEMPEFLYKTLIPCNLYGKYDNFSYSSSHMIPGVIRRIHDAKITNVDHILIWGDGQARREFMYAGDFANFIFFAIESFDRIPQNLNVGLGYDFSIKEYYKIIADEIGFDGKFRHDYDRPIGMKQKLLNIQALLDLGWKHELSVKQGIKETYQFFLESHNA